MGRFLEDWARVNNELNFPFAAHFLQEEAFIWQAILGRIEDVEPAARADLPLVLAELLLAYRSLARRAIAEQAHLPALRAMLADLTGRGVVLGVASNDREYATRALLAWSGLAPSFRFVFTSEGLSRRYEGAEKPSPVFFEAVKREAGIAPGQDRCYYVGDDEKRDVETPRACWLRDHPPAGGGRIGQVLGGRPGALVRRSRGPVSRRLGGPLPAPSVSAPLPGGRVRRCRRRTR